MKAIYKYELEDFRHKLEIPGPAEVLSVKEQNGKIVLYALVDPDSDLIYEKEFLVLPTGMKYDLKDTDVFLDTVMLDGGQFVFHIFER